MLPQVSDQHIETRTCNALLGALPGLPHLEELVMPEARVRKLAGSCSGKLATSSEMCGVERER